MASRARRARRRIALVAGLLAVAGGGAACLLLSPGPIRPPSPLPEGAIVDMHCHVAGIGAGGSGCFISERLRRSWRSRAYLRAFGVDEGELEREGDALVVRRIAAKIAASRLVSGAVLLALDAVVDEAGRPDLARTEVYIPDAFLARETAKYPRLWFGASVHPRRTDALARLRHAAAAGAVLVKWIPSIQEIDPADPSFTPFYREMRRLGLPLLTHTGRERSFTRSRDELADPERLRLPLEFGVTVIAAHGATNGRNGGERNLERLARLAARFPNLYADVSSLTQINKLGQLARLLREPRLEGRLLYGSDFPLTNTLLVSPWYFLHRLSLGSVRRIACEPGSWDRDVLLKQALGVPEDVFARPARLLHLAVPSGRR